MVMAQCTGAIVASALQLGGDRRRCLRGWDLRNKDFIPLETFFFSFCRVLFAKSLCKILKLQKIWWFKNPNILFISQLCWWFCAAVWTIRSLLVSLDASYHLASWVISLGVDLDSPISPILLCPAPVTLKAHQLYLLSIPLLSPLSPPLWSWYGSGRGPGHLSLLGLLIDNCHLTGLLPRVATIPVHQSCRFLIQNSPHWLLDKIKSPFQDASTSNPCPPF